MQLRLAADADANHRSHDPGIVWVIRNGVTDDAQDHRHRNFSVGRASDLTDDLRRRVTPEWRHSWVVANSSEFGHLASGADPQQIIDALLEKQTKNESRIWPHWSTMPADKAIEHDRSGENPVGEGNKPAAAPGIDLTELRARVVSAIERITSGAGQMRVPADMTDPDLVLGDVLTLLDSLGPQSDASPKGGSDAQDAARYRWLRDEAISFPYDVEIASPWCVFGMNTAGADINPIDGARLDAAIDAARRFAEYNEPQATSAEVGE